MILLLLFLVEITVTTVVVGGGAWCLVGCRSSGLFEVKCSKGCSLCSHQKTLSLSLSLPAF